MKPADGATTPVWYEGVTVASESEPPDGPVLADVCVVGAGIAGLTSAYLLAKTGKKVVVLDEGPVASGQSGRTSAHLNSQIDDGFAEIERLHGGENARLAYASHATAVDVVERISRDEKINCEFVRQDAYLFPLPTDKPDALEKELAAAQRAGFPDVELVKQHALRAWSPCPALRFGNQARFHPLKYLVGLASACERLGVRIYTGCRVTAVTGADPKKGTKARATVDTGATTVDADAIIVATNTPAPINDWIGIYLKQAAYRTYMIGLRIPAGSVDDVQYADTGDPYHYVRLEGTDLLLVGGEDHKVGQYPPDTDPFKNLETWARQMFPMAGEVTVRWSGQVQEPADYLGYAGKAPTSGEHVYVITGDSGMGLTHGTLGAMIITDLILGRPNAWTTLYDPERKTLDADLVHENANTMSKYGQLFTGGDVSGVDQIAPGEGSVIRRGLHKIAVYKDPAGQVKEMSALCTHLKCVVHWNRTEKSWDCPCHGSRFSCDGRVLMGPAIDDLPPVE